MDSKLAHCGLEWGLLRKFVIVQAVIFFTLIAGALPVFAGSSGRGATRTFGAYQVDFVSGPVGITIHGHASTQIVAIRTSGMPADIRVHYQMGGGILHVTASLDGSAKTSGKARLVVSMPRYEFVHIKTTSGSVYVNNLSTNHLTVFTQTGPIDITNTNAALRVGSTTGNQNYKQIYGAIDASSTTGNLSIDHTWGIMKLNSTSGSVNARDVDLAGNSTIRTGSGSINFGFTYGLSRYRYLFDLHSTRGKIRLGQIVSTGNLKWGEGNIIVTASTDTGSQDFQ